MNIFMERQVFYVGTKLYTLMDADKDFLSLASSIRQKLGEQAFKFDEYLITIMTAANLSTMQNACEDADEDFKMIRHVCMDVIDDKRQLESHAYYPILKAYIDEHRSCFQDRYTLISAACATAASILTHDMAREYFEALDNDFRGMMDVIELRHLYRDLTYAAGEQDIERLNELIN